MLVCTAELAISRLNLPTDLSLDCHTGHVLIRCATPFGAQKSLSPEAIAAEILCALKKCAEEYLKRRPIKDANNGGEYWRGVEWRRGEWSKREWSEV